MLQNVLHSHGLYKCKPVNLKSTECFIQNNVELSVCRKEWNYTAWYDRKQIRHWKSDARSSQSNTEETP